MQNQIEQIGNKIINEMKYDNGVVYFTISGSSRLVGVDESSIRRASKMDTKLTQFLSQCGVELRELNIGENGIPDYVHALITNYYAYYAGRYCTELAKQADLFFAAVGVRQWVKIQLGVNDQPQAPQTFAQALRLAAEVQEQLEKTEKEKNQQQILSSQLLKNPEETELLITS